MFAVLPSILMRFVQFATTSSGKKKSFSRCNARKATLKKSALRHVREKKKFFLPLPPSFIICVIAIRALPMIFFLLPRDRHASFQGEFEMLKTFSKSKSPTFSAPRDTNKCNQATCASEEKMPRGGGGYTSPYRDKNSISLTRYCGK